MHEEQNIMKMGGLKSKMPKTFLTFAIGWLAICGIPPFSGFFSKDEILWQAFSSPHGSVVLWGLGALTAVMTAFYMTRLFSLTFLGEPRFQEEGAHHDSHGHADQGHADDHGHGHGHDKRVHESPSVMVIPLQILAVLSAVGGLMGIPHMSWLEHWLEPVIPAHEGLAIGISHEMEWVLMGVSVAGAVLGIMVALRFYKNLGLAEAMAKRFAVLHRLLENKWYVDEIYEAILIRPIQKLSEMVWKGIDVGVIDRIVMGFGKVSSWTGETVRVIQTGSIQIYALMLLIGLVATAGYLFYGWT